MLVQEDRHQPTKCLIIILKIAAEIEISVLLRSAWSHCHSIAATIVKMRKVAFDLPKLGKLPCPRRHSLLTLLLKLLFIL